MNVVGQLMLGLTHGFPSIKETITSSLQWHCMRLGMYGFCYYLLFSLYYFIFSDVPCLNLYSLIKGTILILLTLVETMDEHIRTTVV